MVSISSNPEPLIDSPHKHKIPLDNNGNPVRLDKAAMQAPKKPKTVTALVKSATKKVAPAKAPNKSFAAKPAGPPQTQSLSMEIDDAVDEEDVSCSVLPHNPRNILEAADGSDDEPTPGGNKQPRQAKPARDKEDDVEIVNDAEEDPEDNEVAELSAFQFSTIKKMLTCHQNVSWVNGPHQFMCSSGKHPSSNILMSIELMCLNMLLGGARERMGEMSATT